MKIAAKMTCLLVTEFSLNKIRADIIEYLQISKSDLFYENSYQFTIPELNDWDDSQKRKSVQIDGNETLTILEYHFKYQILYGMYVDLIVGIGHYSKTGIHFTIEKCLVKLRYNHDLTLYDAEFFYTNMSNP